MSQRLVIFTVGFHARATCRWLRRQPDRQVVAFVDNNPAVQGTRLLDVPVLAPAALATLAFDRVALPGRNQAPIRAQLHDGFGVGDDRIWLVRKSEVPPAADELARRGAALADLLRRTVAVLEAAGVRHWALHSALLALRRGDEAALFSDFDLGVDAAGFDALGGLFAAGFDLRSKPHPAGAGPQPTRFAQLTLRAATARGDDEPALIDLHPVTLGATEASWPVNHGRLQLPVGFFAGHGTAAYRGVAVRVPAEPEEMLLRLYGPGWRTPVETWDGRYLSPVPTPVFPIN